MIAYCIDYVSGLGNDNRCEPCNGKKIANSVEKDCKLLHVYPGYGGGIFNTGTLTLSDCNVTGNYASIQSSQELPSSSADPAFDHTGILQIGGFPPVWSATRDGETSKTVTSEDVTARGGAPAPLTNPIRIWQMAHRPFAELGKLTFHSHVF